MSADDQREQQPALDLDALEELERAATLGPWLSLVDGYTDTITGEGDDWVDIRSAETSVATILLGDDPGSPDADLIVAARNALPDLIAAARERDELREHFNATTRIYIRLIEQMHEALGLDPDDDETCVPGCAEGPQGSEHSLWHLVQQRDQARALLAKVRLIAGPEDKTGRALLHILEATDGD